MRTQGARLVVVAAIALGACASREVAAARPRPLLVHATFEGRDLEGVRIYGFWRWNFAPTPVELGTTDSRGLVQVDVRSCTLQVRGELPGLGQAVVDLDEDTTRIDLELEREAPIMGRVVDTRGRPVRAWLAARNATLLERETGADGCFSIAGVASGATVELRVSPLEPSYYWFTTATIRAPALDARVVLEPQGLLRVSVLLANKDAAGELVYAIERRDDNGWTEIDRSPTDFRWTGRAPGVLAFERGPITPGVHRLLASMPGGGAIVSEPFKVARGKPTDVRIELERRELRGRVVNERNEPLRASLAFLPYRERGWTDTSADGSFVLRDVPRAEFQLIVRNGKRRRWISVSADAQRVPDIVLPD